jgi:hypothetical protein
MIGYKYTLTNPNGSSFVINDYNTDPNNVIVLQQYPDMDVELNSNEVAKEGAHGIFDLPSFYGKRSISLEGVIGAQDELNLEALKNKIKQTLQLDPNGLNNYLTLSWQDVAGRVWVVECRALNIPRFSRQLRDATEMTFLLQLKSPNPYIYAKNPIVVSGQRGYISAGGVALPMAVPFELLSDYTNTVIIDNQGSAPASPIYKIYGGAIIDLTNPRIINLTTGKEFSLQTTLTGSNSFIQVDTLNGTVTDENGNDVSANIVAGSAYPLLVPGANELVYVTDETPDNSGQPAIEEFEVSYKIAQI